MCVCKDNTFSEIPKHVAVVHKGKRSITREDQSKRGNSPYRLNPQRNPIKLFLDLPRERVFPRRLSEITCHEFYPGGQLSRFPRNATRLIIKANSGTFGKRCVDTFCGGMKVLGQRRLKKNFSRQDLSWSLTV